MSDPLKQTDASVEQGGDDPRCAFWRKELELGHKREKKFQEDADKVTKLYEGEKRDENSFNILYSNTCILLPACYNQLPRPYVDRRFQDPDPLGKLAAQALERVLSSLEDTGDSEYTPFDDLLEQAVLGALVPGRGLTKFRYEAHITQPSAPTESRREPSFDTGESEREEEKNREAGAGHAALDVPGNEKVGYECISGDDVDYSKVVFGYARRWVHVPWLAFIHYMERADAIKSFGEEIAELLTYSDQSQLKDGWKKTNDPASEDQETQKSSLPVACVYEIWNKRKKEVVFFAPSVKDRLLKVVEDPYELSGFFPCPAPLMLFTKRSKLTPTPLYNLYEAQAKELNRLSMRINRILHAMKVRGFYDGTLQGLKELLASDDNTLLPARNVAAMREGQTVENSIWLMPVEGLIKVLMQLYPAREQCKNTIYEITGISDIMRGDTQASETATAQNIKNTYGTLRLNKMRKKIQVYARDCLRVMGELASKHFDIKTFAEMTNLPFALPEEIAQAKKTQQFLNQQLMKMQQQAQLRAQLQAPPPAGPAPPLEGGQAPPQAPAGPPQVQPTPQMQEQMQKVQEVLSKPPWEDIVGLLRDDLLRYYRIDVETNSTIASDTAEDKQNIIEALEVIGNIFKNVAPLAEQGVLPVPVVKSMILTVARRFQFGREVEDELAQMPEQTPPPKQEPGKAGPTPEEMQAKAAEAVAKMEQIKLQAAARERENQLATQEHQLTMAQRQRDDELSSAKHQQSMAQIAAESQMTQLELQAKQQELAMSVQAKEKILTFDVASSREGLKNAQEQGRIKREDAALTRQQKMADEAAKPAKPNGEAKPRGPRKVEIQRGTDGKMTGFTVH